MLKRHSDIQVGQFYRAEGADGYYYVGVQYGKNKRLVCVNCEPHEATDENPFFPKDNLLLKDWEMVKCNETEVKKEAI